MKDEFISIDEVANRERIRRGELLHFLFSQDGDLKQAKLQYPEIKEWEEYAETVADVIQSTKLKQFFTTNDTYEVQNEVDIVNRFGQTKRIDRLIVKEKEVWVIDYKSTREGEEQHQSQVREYMGILKDIYPKKKIKGFLIYLDEKQFEEVKKIGTDAIF